MKHIRISGRRRLTAAAVTAALAVTGGTIAAVPATAAPAPGATQQDRQDQQDQQTTVAFPRNADVVGAGPSGFLSKTRGTTPEYRWTWYADGTSIVLPGATVAAAGGTDRVVTVDRTAPVAGRVARVYDLSTPATAAVPPQDVNLDALGDGLFFEGLAGNEMLLGQYRAGGPVKQYAVTLDGGTPKLRFLTGGAGLDCSDGQDGWTDAGSALYECRFEAAALDAKVVVDPATGASSTYLQTEDEWARPGAVSATHVAWREARMSGGRAVHGIVAHQRGKSGERWLPSDDDLSDPMYLVGGWAASGQKIHIDASSYLDGGDNPTKRPFTVQSVETGEKAVLLTAFSSATAGPGGSLLVRGGTPERGEGLYRISPRADGGRPEVELVATTGQSTVLALTGATTPTTLTGDQAARGVDFSWDLSRGDARVWVSLTHVSTGQSISDGWSELDGAVPGMPRRISWHWDGKDLEGRDWGRPARNGVYEWKLTARPDDGIGPEVVTTGRFTVTRPAAPHDYDDDGAADLLVRDLGGVLWRLGTRPATPGGSLADAGGSRVGGGWQVYDRLESVGDVAGTNGAPDVIARDASGVLWLYPGTGVREKALTGRTRIGGGWQVYDQLAGGSDVTGDGRPDLLATDKAGVMFLYRGTGNANAPFAAAKRLGAGWGVYNQLTATGNIAGAPAGDLLARDKAGVLWMYLGKGDGTFANRVRVGAGWNAFTGLIAVGDANGDGRADLVATNGDETFYAGTGSWSAPFKRGTSVSLTQDMSYNTAF
ncbi:FG-GAP repeat domain-containing protein [Streptomyces sp. NPDC048330]|uniref:FG-GAP repeat domain-containing protein n=1 Tax=Streptomyces sp. NPDC048330 TaxID=3365533 RepID=UPI00371834A0